MVRLKMAVKIKMRKNQKKEGAMGNSKGFTLPELLVAMVVTAVITASVYSVYRSQQKSFLVQDQVAEMQQNLRAALHLMEREIRMAGYDPSGKLSAGIQSMNSANLRFTQDIHDGVDNDGDGLIDEPDEAGNSDGDVGDPGEDITYLLFDQDGDGDLDLCRSEDGGATVQLLAENIDALNFVFRDALGAVTSTPSKVRSIQISIVARANRPDLGYENNSSYANQQGTTILLQQHDAFRREMLSTEVRCRNLGLI
jgi:type IV pilus assembly protein PilW